MIRFTTLLLLLVPCAAFAQSKKIEIAVGAALDGPASAGSTRAELLNPGGSPVTLFEATHRSSFGAGAAASLVYRLRPRLALEVSGTWTRPQLETRIADDFEGAPGTTLSLGMHRFTADASVVRHFARRGATEPFVRIGGGWYRELTTDRALVDDGAAAHAGGGLNYWLREGRRGLFGHVALRADARVVMRRGGIDLGDRNTTWSPAATLTVVVAR